MITVISIFSIVFVILFWSMSAQRFKKCKTNLNFLTISVILIWSISVCCPQVFTEFSGFWFYSEDLLKILNVKKFKGITKIKKRTVVSSIRF